MDCENNPLKHKHHIVPRYKGGSDEPENLVELTVTQHAMYHFCNYQLWGNVEDYVAWRGLSGQIEMAEFLIEKQRIFGKQGSAILREKLKNDLEFKEKATKNWSESWNKNREKNIEKNRSNLIKAVEVARSPEANKKRIETLKAINHQQGSTNSQYGTMWIHNMNLKQNKKISNTDPIPEGWVSGRIMDFDEYIKAQELKEQKRQETLEKLKQRKLEVRQEKVKLYNEWYEVYKTTDFKTFCSITGYNKTQQNLCSKFKEFVESYDPKAKNKYTN